MQALCCCYSNPCFLPKQFPPRFLQAQGKQSHTQGSAGGLRLEGTSRQLLASRLPRADSATRPEHVAQGFFHSALQSLIGWRLLKPLVPPAPLINLPHAERVSPKQLWEGLLFHLMPIVSWTTLTLLLLFIPVTMLRRATCTLEQCLTFQRNFEHTHSLLFEEETLPSLYDGWRWQEEAGYFPPERIKNARQNNPDELSAFPKEQCCPDSKLTQSFASRCAPCSTNISATDVLGAAAAR